MGLSHLQASSQLSDSGPAASAYEYENDTKRDRTDKVWLRTKVYLEPLCQESRLAILYDNNLEKTWKKRKRALCATSVNEGHFQAARVTTYATTTTKGKLEFQETMHGNKA
eukprot:1159207-Pelagomonas_calceolata.AAC.14